MWLGTLNFSFHAGQIVVELEPKQNAVIRHAAPSCSLDTLSRRNLNAQFNSIYCPTKTEGAETKRGALGRVSELLRQSSQKGQDVDEMIKAGPIAASLAASFSATLAAAATPYVFAVIAPSVPAKEVCIT